MAKRIIPNVVRGGAAIPLKGKTNYYYMTGRKHKNGGIDIGKNPRTGLEVEDGEVMHVSKNEVKIFSSVPFLNGESPAEKVMKGDNPSKVFNAQEKYKDKNNINDDGTKKKKRMGGLSRSKDYGSKSKPYPKVKAGDFAGGNRSYPIPTKADAVDALRLAGLHGRSDVRAKVYNKYPELRKKSKAGGLYSVTVDGKTKLKMFPSTGERTKAALGLEKVGDFIKNNPTIIADGIGLTSNLVGSIVSHKINKDILNKMQYSSQPVSRTATKLKTRININPQLDKMRETLSAYERDIDNNTASSRVALARKQRARLANMLQTNELYGNKENIETELINKDRLNQQAVADSNIRDYNAWRERKVAFDNAILEKKAENDISLAENINTGIQDLISRGEKRKNENQTITAMALANPNLPIEVFYEQGLINKKTYNAYKKAYRNNKKDKQD